MSYPDQEEVEKGDKVQIRYKSTRTGNLQEVTGVVKNVYSIGQGPELYDLKVKDESRNRTIHVQTNSGVVETRERRGHMLMLGDLLSVKAEGDEL